MYCMGLYLYITEDELLKHSEEVSDADILSLYNILIDNGINKYFIAEHQILTKRIFKKYKLEFKYTVYYNGPNGVEELSFNNSSLISKDTLIGFLEGLLRGYFYKQKD